MGQESEVRVRNLEDTDLGDIVALDEKILGEYRPDVWENRITYYFRRDPEASQVAVADGKVVGFMLGEVRSGEFGLEEPTGWIEVLGVDPDYRGQAIGRQLAERMLDYFRKNGAVSVRTFVDEESMADIARFFEAVGFRPSRMRSFVMTIEDSQGATA